MPDKLKFNPIVPPFDNVGEVDRLISTNSTLILSDDTTDQTLTGNLGELNFTGNTSYDFISAPLVVNATADADGSGNVYPLVLRGRESTLANRRGGAIAWEYDNAGDIMGYMFVNRTSQIGFRDTVQVDRNDAGFAHIDLTDGSASFGSGGLSIGSDGSFDTQTIHDVGLLMPADTFYESGQPSGNNPTVAHELQTTNTQTATAYTSGDFDTGDMPRLFTVFNGLDTGATHWKDNNEKFSVYPNGFIACPFGGLFLGADPTDALTGNSGSFGNFVRISKDFIGLASGTRVVAQLITSRTMVAAGSTSASITGGAFEIRETSRLATSYSGRWYGGDFQVKQTFSQSDTTAATISATITGGNFVAGVTTANDIGAKNYTGVIAGGRFSITMQTAGTTHTVANKNFIEAYADANAVANGTQTNTRGFYLSADLTDKYNSTNVHAIEIVSQTTNGAALKGNINMAGGNWNSGHLQLENGHIWYDATNDRFRVSKDQDGSAPTAEIDGFPVPLSYGHMYSNSAISVALTTTNVWLEVGTTWTTGKTNLCTFQNAKEIVVVEAGTYQITWTMSTAKAAGTSQELEGGIMIDNSVTDGTGVQNEGRSHRLLSNNADIGAFSSTCILDLAASKIVSLALRSASGTPTTVTVEHANLSIVRIK